MHTTTKFLEMLAAWVRTHTSAAWVLQDAVIIESHGRCNGFDITTYDAVRTVEQARDVLGY